MSSKHAEPALARRSKLQWPLLAIIVLVVVAAGYALVRMTFAASGTMSVQSASSSVGLGSDVTVSVRVNGGTEALNAVQADLTYPANLLEFKSVDTTGTAFPTTAQNVIGNGTLSLPAGIQPGTNPVTGDVQVANITFKAIGIGNATVGVANTSLGLRASDSTNALVGYNGKTLAIVDTTAPAAPTGITRTSGTLTSITLAWTAPTDNVGVTGYRVMRGSTQVGTPTAASFTDTGLAAGTSYNYTVTAVDAAGNVSAASSIVSLATNTDTTAPSVPAAPTASARTLNSISLAWTAATDDVGVTGYKVFRGATQVGSVASASFTDTGLAAGASYAYQITANDAAGNTSAKSAVANLTTLADTVAPSIPAGLTVVSQAGGSVKLSWTASTDNTGVAGYKIFRGGAEVATSATTTATVAVPTTAGSYNYTVAAVDAAGNVSAQSGNVAITVYGPADINKDGKVNAVDLSLLLSGWGKPGATDVNGDGNTTVIDLSLLISAWTR